MSMNSLESVYRLNQEVMLDPYKWQVGNGTLPLDFLQQAQVPRPARGAGYVPPEGPYATEIDVSNREELPDDKKPHSYVVPVALTGIALAFLLMR